MGKRKDIEEDAKIVHSKQLLKGKNKIFKAVIEEASEKQNYAINVFLEVWSQLEVLYVGRQQFALAWLLKDNCALDMYVKRILKLDFDFSRHLMFNGYHACNALSLPILSPTSWRKVHAAFSQDISFTHLPRPIRLLIRELRFRDMWELLSDAILTWNTETSFSKEEITVSLVPPLTIRKCKGCFLGDWDESVVSSLCVEGVAIFLKYPTEFCVIKKSKNFTFFYDRSGKVPRLVAMVMQQSLLEEGVMVAIRALLEHLFVSHRAIMRGALKRSYKGQMTGFGPMFNRFKKNKDLVSFFCHAEKIRNTLPLGQTSLNLQFEKIIDRYSHGDLVDIILGLYLRWCPELLRSFFQFSKPYLDPWQYDHVELEKYLGGRKPSTYQLYISKDYCSRMHRDVDASEFTLCYVSHPDSASSTPIDFVIPEVGIRIPLHNGNLFSFRSSLVHGTGYRVPTSNVAYVGCVTVNRGLNGVMQRRQNM